MLNLVTEFLVARRGVSGPRPQGLEAPVARAQEWMAMVSHPPHPRPSEGQLGSPGCPSPNPPAPWSLRSPASPYCQVFAHAAAPVRMPSLGSASGNPSLGGTLSPSSHRGPSPSGSTVSAAPPTSPPAARSPPHQHGYSSVNSRPPLASSCTTLAGYSLASLLFPPPPDSWGLACQPLPAPQLPRETGSSPSRAPCPAVGAGGRFPEASSLVPR